MGCKDMIIAASGDGILISDKERSGYMKPYVEKIETEAMVNMASWFRKWTIKNMKLKFIYLKLIVKNQF